MARLLGGNRPAVRPSRTARDGRRPAGPDSFGRPPGCERHRTRSRTRVQPLEHSGCLLTSPLVESSSPPLARRPVFSVGNWLPRLLTGLVPALKQEYVAGSGQRRPVESCAGTVWYYPKRWRVRARRAPVASMCVRRHHGQLPERLGRYCRQCVLLSDQIHRRASEISEIVAGTRECW